MTTDEMRARLEAEGKIDPWPIDEPATCKCGSPADPECHVSAYTAGCGRRNIPMCQACFREWWSRPGVTVK